MIVDNSSARVAWTSNNTRAANHVSPVLTNEVRTIRVYMRPRASNPLSNELDQNKHVNNQAALLSSLTSGNTKLSRTESLHCCRISMWSSRGYFVLQPTSPGTARLDKTFQAEASLTCFYPALVPLIRQRIHVSVYLRPHTTNGLRYQHRTILYRDRSE